MRAPGIALAAHEQPTVRERPINPSGRVSHPCSACSVPYDTRGWDHNYGLCARDCTDFTELVMWRTDHRIPPFAKTKTAKDGPPSCVVAQAKVGHPPFVIVAKAWSNNTKQVPATNHNLY